MLPFDVPELLAILRCAPEFFEQPHVLDGDHRLVGEGFKQGDLLVGEWLHLQTANSNDTNGNAFAD